MKTKFYPILLCAALCACGDGNAKQQASATDEKVTEEKTVPQPTPEKEDIWYDGEIPIIFDAYKDYPITDIKLSELADAEYIALETTDESVPVLSVRAKATNIYLPMNTSTWKTDRKKSSSLPVKESSSAKSIAEVEVRKNMHGLVVLPPTPNIMKSLYKTDSLPPTVREEAERHTFMTWKATIKDISRTMLRK